MYHKNVRCKCRKIPTRTTIIDVKGLCPLVNVSDGRYINYRKYAVVVVVENGSFKFTIRRESESENTTENGSMKNHFPGTLEISVKVSKTT